MTPNGPRFVYGRSVSQGEQLHAEVLRGRFGPALAAIASLRETEPAWAVLIERSHALASGAELALGPVPSGPGAWRLALFLVREAITGIRPMPEVARPDHPVAGPLIDGWRALATGGAPVALEEVAAEARRAQQPALVVECAALTALFAARDGDHREALRHGRRASRMARTESLPQSEYLAGLTLARLRRQAGHPHLAARILLGLRPFVSPHWLPWLEWELALAGDRSVSTPAATALLTARRAAGEGERAGLEAALTDARTRVAGFRLLADEAEHVAALLEPDAPRLTAEQERAFSAFAGDAYVVCSPSGPGRRVREASLPLVSATVVESGGKKQKRIATLAAVLGLAGAPLDEAECFERVYGFRFVPEMHRGSFDVLLHRARASLEGLATFERSGDTVAMQVLAPFAIADPRMVEPAEARVLRAIASGGTTAKEIAGATGLSLRQTQTLLKSLADEGECAATKEGRIMRYAVEDTTFSEPTRA